MGIFILLTFSIVGIISLLAWKYFETKSEKDLAFSAMLKKSDVYFEYKIIGYIRHYRRFKHILAGDFRSLVIFLDDCWINFIEWYQEKRVVLINKIIDKLEDSLKRKQPTDKSSVSLFLRSISDSKNKSRK